MHKPRYQRFLRNEHGITALEFAMVAPVFMLLVMGVVEMSLIMFTSVALESATNNTARLGKTGYVASNKTRQQTILDNVKAKTAGLLNPNDIQVSTEVYSNFDKVGQPEPCISPVNPPCTGTAGINFVDVNGNGTWDQDMAQSGQGNAGDVVVYTVSYRWQIMTPMVGSIIGNPFTISARSVVRNEPF